MPELITNISNKRNFVINGNQDIWQTGTTFNNAAESTYTSDMWVSYNNSTSTVNVTRQDISSLGIGSAYCLRSERSAGTDLWKVENNLENNSLNRLKGDYVTLSLLLRKGASLTSDVTIYVQTSSTELRDGSSVESASKVISNSDIDTTVFKLFKVTLFIPFNTTASGLRVGISASQLGSANAYFEFTQVMLNQGMLSAPFSLAGVSFTGEVIEAQRFYEKSYNLNVAPGTVSDSGSGYIRGVPSSSRFDTQFQFKVLKRDIPTVTPYSPATGSSNVIRDIAAATDRTVTINSVGHAGFGLQNTSGVDLSGNGAFFHWVADARL